MPPLVQLLKLFFISPQISFPLANLFLPQL
uniref:Uncharacterized protein n=1 Tax=virus sp. ctBM815 TaxID=2825806 RepID=A0A8S5RK94_9VIRU|nr:MAG TPA: hypothetical protein [virus sp. ctBM815]DAF82547.1 MAG TPA: hypothetical protein [Caudoviricetes sp.]DAG45372.1 MAG TPA: hypothetical protein [Caudoviricetes sp.]DAV24046.1 MAG TPA: hypothetical protein [Bacteriophage sp.]